MAIALDAVSSLAKGGVGGFTTASWTHTTGSLTDGYMIVGSSWYSTGTVSGITYNADALTQIGSDSANSGFPNLKCSQYRRIAPDAGTDLTVTATLSVSTNEYVGGAITLSGVDQTTPEGTQARAEGSDGTATVAVTSVADDWCVDVVARLGSGAATPGAGQTERWDLEAAPSTAIFGWGSTETATGTSTTMSSTFTTADWAICGVAVKPAAAAAGHPAIRRLGMSAYGRDVLGMEGVKVA